MKIILRHLLFLLAFCFAAGVEKSNAQVCNPNFSFTAGPSGQVNFTLTATTTTATTFSWFFGNGNSILSSTLQTVSNTYTNNGSYPATLIMNTGTGTCSITQTVTLNSLPVPTCSLQINYTYPNPPTACNGAANVTGITGLCGTPSYTWSTGANTPGITGLCQGQNYSVFVSSVNGTQCCSLISGTVSMPVCSLTGSISAVTGNNNTVFYTATANGTVAGTTYSWNFGDGGTGTGSSPSHTYGATGIYTVQMVVSNNNYPFCVDTVYYPINFNYCSLNANFSFTNIANGTVNFISTATGTTAATQYSWNYGSANSSSAGINLVNVSHTYPGNGTYTVVLQLSNGANCISLFSQTVNVGNAPAPCNLAAGFVYSVSPAGLGLFTNTSTGTITSSTYTWMVNGNPVGTSAGSQAYQFTSAGTQTVTLFITNNTIPSCTADTSKQIVVACTVLQASFTHTVGNGGVVNFNSTTNGTNTGTSYFWNFGDGVYGSGSAPTHTYMSAGAYNVSLKANNLSCSDSTILAINVTGIGCMANPNFVLSPSGVPQYWTAVPVYPWNVTDASWNWGDGSVSNQLYASHIYSVAGSYNICLSVTVSCGDTASACSFYSVFRTQNTESMIYVNVKRPDLSTGLANTGAEAVACTVYPNPSTGSFYLGLAGLGSERVQIQVYNLVGGLVYETEQEAPGGQLTQSIDLGQAAAGVYFIRVHSGGAMFTKKVIVQKP